MILPAAGAVVLRTSTTWHPHDLIKAHLGPLEELLLDADDHTGPADAHPSDQSLCIEAELVHNVESDQCAGPAQACTAVHCHSLPSARVTFHDGDEVADDCVVGTRAVRELHLMHVDLMLSEAGRVVQFPVQADNAAHVQVLKRVDQVCWAHITLTHHAIVPVNRSRGILRRGESYDLIRHDPA